MLVYGRPVEIWRDFVPSDDVLALATSELRALGGAAAAAQRASGSSVAYALHAMRQTRAKQRG